MKKWRKRLEKKTDVECNFYTLAEDVPDPREQSSEKNNLMVFDDLLLEKQNTCESYYVRGRHISVDYFYLAQNYFKAPTPNNERDREFHMSVFPRPEEP